MSPEEVLCFGKGLSNAHRRVLVLLWQVSAHLPATICPSGLRELAGLLSGQRWLCKGVASVLVPCNPGLCQSHSIQCPQSFSICATCEEDTMVRVGTRKRAWGGGQRGTAGPINATLLAMLLVKAEVSFSHLREQGSHVSGTWRVLPCAPENRVHS